MQYEIQHIQADTCISRCYGAGSILQPALDNLLQLCYSLICDFKLNNVVM